MFSRLPRRWDSAVMFRYVQAELWFVIYPKGQKSYSLLGIFHLKAKEE